MDIFKENTLTFYRDNEVKNRAGKAIGETVHHGLHQYKRMARRKARKKIKKIFNKLLTNPRKSAIINTVIKGRLLIL